MAAVPDLGNTVRAVTAALDRGDLDTAKDTLRDAVPALGLGVHTELSCALADTVAIPEGTILVGPSTAVWANPFREDYAARCGVPGCRWTASGYVTGAGALRSARRHADDDHEGLPIIRSCQPGQPTVVVPPGPAAELRRTPPRHRWLQFVADGRAAAWTHAEYDDPAGPGRRVWNPVLPDGHDRGHVWLATRPVRPLWAPTRQPAQEADPGAPTIAVPGRLMRIVLTAAGREVLARWDREAAPRQTAAGIQDGGQQ